MIACIVTMALWPVRTGWNVLSHAVRTMIPRRPANTDARSTRAGPRIMLRGTCRAIILDCQQLTAHLTKRKMLNHACDGTACCQASA